MPGITGIITKNARGNEEQMLHIMVQTMMYEPFYRKGKYIDAKGGYFIGYTVIEGAFADCMPIYNETKDLLMFLTGETFMDSALIAELKTRHTFDTNNANYLIHLYEELGDRFFNALNGWHNGLIIDNRKHKAFLFNDRFGMRRIYYYENDDAFIFSTEAKSLLAADTTIRKPNEQSIGEYLVYDCVLENRTYFKDVFLLPQGAAWSFDHGHIQKNQYFEPSDLENLSPLNQDQYFEELSDTFVKILPRYFHGEKISMSLTGGLDTRMIMACLDPQPGTLPCFTFGGKYRDILDVRLAPRVAIACNQSHTLLQLDDDKYLADYPYQVERAIFITDGVQGVHTADAIYFNQMASEIAPIRMTGKYGSQVLKRVFGLQDRSPENDLIHPAFSHHLSKAKDTCAKLRKGNEFSFRLYSEIPWWWNGFTAAESSQVAVRSPYLDNDFVKLLYQAPSGLLDYGAAFQLELINKYKPELMKIPTTGTHGGSDSKLISEIRKNYYKLMSNVDKMYIREKLPYSLTHWIGRFDYLTSPLHIDRLFAGHADFRRYRVWYRDQLAPYLYDTLLSDRTFNRPYWNKNELIKVVNDHTHGRGTYLREIRKVLQMELVHRIMLEGIPQAYQQK